MPGGARLARLDPRTEGAGSKLGKESLVVSRTTQDTSTISLLFPHLSRQEGLPFFGTVSVCVCALDVLHRDGADDGDVDS
jgi:hypothetical protein